MSENSAVQPGDRRSIKPEVDQMKENVSNLTKEAKETVDGIKNEL